eukprot:gene14492-biopygen9640
MWCGNDGAMMWVLLPKFGRTRGGATEKHADKQRYERPPCRSRSRGRRGFGARWGGAATRCKRQ